MTFDFKGKVAVVTGAGQGMGETFALSFAKAGASVVIAELNEETGNKVAKQIQSMGRQALAVKTDVASSADVARMVKQTLDKFNRIDILVNNAGHTKVSPTEDENEADWDRIIDINMKGVFLCCRDVGRQMIKQKEGKIVSIASSVAHQAVPTQVAYCASKAGVVMITKVLAVEWAKHNINVNAVSPGMTLTPIVLKLAKDGEKYMQDVVSKVPNKRLNQTQDIANAVMFLCSPAAANITGHTLLVDGGSAALWSGNPYPGF